MKKKRLISSKTPQAFLNLGLVLALLLVAVAAVSAQGDTFSPPEIYKVANDTLLTEGDSVRFTITVINPPDPPDPLVPTTWYNVRVTDEIDPIFRIDAVNTTMGTATVTGQTVVVNGGITLQPGESFEITIDCTVVGPIPPGGTVVINEAILEYTDEEGDPQDPIISPDPPRIIIEEEEPPPEEPPFVPEASSLLLLASGATGLAGYVGLQIRARRRK